MSLLLPSPLFARLADDALDAVLVVDADGTMRYANAAMQELCGYACGELIGEALTGLLPDNVAPQHQQYVLAYITGNQPSRVLGQVRAFAIKHRTGAMIPVEVKAVDLGAHEGARFFGAVLEDLRPRRQMEAEHAALLARLEQQALSDPLTGLANRRAFANEAASAIARAERSGTAITVGVADIDHFKQVNDRHGHPAGDQVLATIANVIRNAARGSDLVARIGGEEFGLLLPEAGTERALHIAERIREAVAGCVVPIASGQSLSVTISIGLTRLEPGMSIEEALGHADTALYEAKNSGRNCVRLAR